MDIKGNHVQFTPSEAHWAQITSERSGFMPELAQRIQEARVARISKQVGINNLPPPAATTKHDAIARIRRLATLNDLLKTELQDTVDENGKETPIVDVQLSREEKLGLLISASVDYEVARDQIVIPEVAEVEDQASWDDFALIDAILDAVDPEEAIVVGDTFRDPGMRADHYNRQREEARKKVAILWPIISALVVDLA